MQTIRAKIEIIRAFFIGFSLFYSRLNTVSGDRCIHVVIFSRTSLPSRPAAGREASSGDETSISMSLSNSHPHIQSNGGCSIFQIGSDDNAVN
jgi:hypothetical protein